mgnify:CR=1 FL=1
MKITFKSDKDKKLYNSSKEMSKKYGSQAREIQKRLLQIESSPTMKQFAFDRPHSLEWNLKWCIAIDIKHPYRIIIRPVWEFDLSDRETITEIEVQELNKDYH